MQCARSNSGISLTWNIFKALGGGCWLHSTWVETKLHRHGGQNKIIIILIFIYIITILNFCSFKDNYNRTIIDNFNFRFSTSCNSEKVETANTLRISCEPQLQTLSTTTYICSVILIYEGSKICQENGLNIALKFVMGRWRKRTAQPATFQF